MLNKINEFLDKKFNSLNTDNTSQNLRNKRAWHLLRAMTRGYLAAYSNDGFKFEILGNEIPFRIPIFNPHSENNQGEKQSAATSFDLCGVIDAVVKVKLNFPADTNLTPEQQNIINDKHCEFYLIERKSASVIDTNYIENLPHDFQTQLYCYAFEKNYGIKISGVLYDVALKAGIRQTEGETENQYQLRYDELCRKNKNGKSTATRKTPESDNDFQDRLWTEIYEPGATRRNKLGEIIPVVPFYRERLYFDSQMLNECQSEIWSLKDQLLFTRRTDAWTRSPRRCSHDFGNSKCVYYPICWARNPENIIENYFQPCTAYNEIPEHIKKINQREILTYSSMQSFNDCKRKFHLRYIRNFEPIEQNENLFIGSLWHEILAMIFESYPKASESEMIKNKFKTENDIPENQTFEF